MTCLYYNREIRIDSRLQDNLILDPYLLEYEQAITVVRTECMHTNKYLTIILWPAGLSLRLLSQELNYILI